MSLKKILIVILSISCFVYVQNTSFVFAKAEKETVKFEKTETKSVRCNNCPCNCLIKPNQEGDCGQYKNVDGEIVPVKNNS